MTYFVVADVHGFYDELLSALNRKKFDTHNPEHCLIVCGDLFDRGEQAVEVFEFIKTLALEKRLIYIRGNHEDLLFECYDQLKDTGGAAASYHYSNGTIGTIKQFKDEGILSEVMSFIDDESINYYELGKYIFVHGWIPCHNWDIAVSTEVPLEKISDWRHATKEQWEQARWINGMKAWKMGATEEDKIFVCGHFHSGWGHYNLHHKYDDEYQCFEPFIDKGIIALDGMTAYSHVVNVLVLNETDLNKEN